MSVPRRSAACAAVYAYYIERIKGADEGGAMRVAVEKWRTYRPGDSTTQASSAVMLFINEFLAVLPNGGIVWRALGSPARY